MFQRFKSLIKSHCVHFLSSSWIYNFLSGYLEKPIHTKLDKNVSLQRQFQLVKGGAEIQPLRD